MIDLVSCPLCQFVHMRLRRNGGELLRECQGTGGHMLFHFQQEGSAHKVHDLIWSLQLPHIKHVCEYVCVLWLKNRIFRVRIIQSNQELNGSPWLGHEKRPCNHTQHKGCKKFLKSMASLLDSKLLWNLSWPALCTFAAWNEEKMIIMQALPLRRVQFGHTYTITHGDSCIYVLS